MGSSGTSPYERVNTGRRRRYAGRAGVLSAATSRFVSSRTSA
jgi:hypothetical protein